MDGRAIVEQPNWAQLEAFYADPAGNAWETELEFLNGRARLLESCFQSLLGAQPPPTVPDDPHSRARLRRRWAVSDFWLEQSAAFARAWLPAGQLAAFLEQHERLRQTAPRPILIVLLDAPAERLLARVRRRGRGCQRHLTAEQLERIRQSLIEQAGRPELGPVLRPGGDDPEAVFAETLAAVQGME